MFLSLVTKLVFLARFVVPLRLSSRPTLILLLSLGSFRFRLFRLFHGLAIPCRNSASKYFSISACQRRCSTGFLLLIPRSPYLASGIHFTPDLFRFPLRPI